MSKQLDEIRKREKLLREYFKKHPVLDKSWAEISQIVWPGSGKDWARKVAPRLGIKVKKPKPTVYRPIVIEDKTRSEMTPQEKLLLERAKKEQKWGTWAQMTQECNPETTNMDWAQDVFKKYNFVIKPRVATPQTQIEDRRRESESAELRDQNRDLANQLSAMQTALERYANISGYDPKKFAIKEPVSKKSHEATAILQLSDVHCEEPVIASTVNGLNEYNLDIAKKRVSKVFENYLKLTNAQRQGVDIKESLIHLGGDFISGYIHPEGEQENLLSPIDACKYSIDLLVSGIEYTLKNGDFNTIRLVCSRGNHGRTSPRPQSNDFSMNYEVFIYYFLMNYFKDEPKIIFKADDSSYSYVSVYEKILRFFHGNQLRFAGGIGGLTVPLVKLILRLDASIKASHNFLGDKHVYCQPMPRATINGSVIGYNLYAAEQGFEFQEPVQAFTLWDSKRGATIKAPVFCD